MPDVISDVWLDYERTLPECLNEIATGPFEYHDSFGSTSYLAFARGDEIYLARIEPIYTFDRSLGCRIGSVRRSLGKEIFATSIDKFDDADRNPVRIERKKKRSARIACQRHVKDRFLRLTRAS